MKNKLLKRSNGGFSLVELIVVIAIMAILVGVAVPVYSSYIEKANKAKDEQLLGEINSAFAVVLAGNAIDINSVTEADIPIESNGKLNLAGMTVKINGTADGRFADAMVEILGTDLKFELIEDIWYNSSTHKFEDNSPQTHMYGEHEVFLRAEDIAKLKASGFLTADGLNVGVLLGQVDHVAGFAAALDSTLFQGVLGNPEYMKSFLVSLGVDVSSIDDEDLPLAYGEKMNELGMAKAKSICTHVSESEDACDECFTSVMEKVAANAVVLYAAQNTTNNDIIGKLQGDNATQELINGMGSDDKGAGISQVASAYGLYMSYAYSIEDPEERQMAIDKLENPLDVMGALNEPGFKAYLATSQAQTDLDGYLAAMNMMNDSTKNNGDAVADVLVNGFGNQELVDTFEGALGQ